MSFRDVVNSQHHIRHHLGQALDDPTSRELVFERGFRVQIGSIEAVLPIAIPKSASEKIDAYPMDVSEVLALADPDKKDEEQVYAVCVISGPIPLPASPYFIPGPTTQIGRPNSESTSPYVAMIVDVLIDLPAAVQAINRVITRALSGADAFAKTFHEALMMPMEGYAAGPWFFTRVNNNPYVPPSLVTMSGRIYQVVSTTPAIRLPVLDGNKYVTVPFVSDAARDTFLKKHGALQTATTDFHRQMALYGERHQPRIPFGAPQPRIVIPTDSGNVIIGHWRNILYMGVDLSHPERVIAIVSTPESSGQDEGGIKWTTYVLRKDVADLFLSGKTEDLDRAGEMIGYQTLPENKLSLERSAIIEGQGASVFLGYDPSSEHEYFTKTLLDDGSAETADRVRKVREICNAEAGRGESPIKLFLNAIGIPDRKIPADVAARLRNHRGW